MSVVRILVTGAAGQIGYSILPLLARGEAVAASKRVHLVMHDLPEKATIMEGVAMELEDCAFTSLDGVTISTEPSQAFKGIDVAVLLASCPWKKGMERVDLLNKNRQIFAAQGEILSKQANQNAKVVVVGNPANTNAFILYRSGAGFNPANVSCLSRLDHNRSVFQVAQKLGVSTSEIKKVTVWGNHSNTQYPDLSFTQVSTPSGSQSVIDQIDSQWIKTDFVKIIKERVWEVANRRNNTSALSPAVAVVNHLRNWLVGTPKDDWVSMGVVSDGSYGVPKGLVSSFPVTVETSGEYKIVPGLHLSDDARKNIDVSIKEMLEELKNAGMSL